MLEIDGHAAITLNFDLARVVRLSHVRDVRGRRDDAQHDGAAEAGERAKGAPLGVFADRAVRLSARTALVRTADAERAGHLLESEASHRWPAVQATDGALVDGGRAGIAERVAICTLSDGRKHSGQADGALELLEELVLLRFLLSLQFPFPSKVVTEK